MTGTGTQADPYIILTADDLYEIGTVGGTTAYFRLDADIDFNETAYAESFSPITLKCAELDGNGHTIRNIYYTNQSGCANVFTSCSRYDAPWSMTVKNLKMENIYLSGAITYFLYSPSDLEDCPIVFSNCSIACSFKPSTLLANSNYTYKGFMSDGNRYIEASYCTFVITAENAGPHPLFYRGSLNCCHINVNFDILETAVSLYNREAFFRSVNMTDVAIFGKIRSKTDKESSEWLFSADGTHSNVYQVMEYENIDTAYWNSLISTVCFYDGEVKGDRVNITNNNTSYYPQNIHGLTTAQCKSAEYLKSIGFLCEGAE